VTTLQLARAYAAIAAGGVLRPLSLVVVDEPTRGERAISTATAEQLVEMMQAVISPQGTGQRAAVKNFSVAGKTGTAWISSVGGYTSNRYTAVFGGMVPASDPRLVAVVVINDPQGEQYNGGDIAAPVFARIATGALRLLAVPPDRPQEPPLTVVAQVDL
jgi:cell division protein FtsI (penicillin-binding protein 3)